MTLLRTVGGSILIHPRGKTSMAATPTTLAFTSPTLGSQFLPTVTAALSTTTVDAVLSIREPPLSVMDALSLPGPSSAAAAKVPSEPATATQHGNSHKPSAAAVAPLAPLEFLQNHRRGSITDPSLHAAATSSISPSSANLPPIRQPDPLTCAYLATSVTAGHVFINVRTNSPIASFTSIQVWGHPRKQYTSTNTQPAQVSLYRERGELKGA